jgi:mycofactocin precursor
MFENVMSPMKGQGIMSAETVAVDAPASVTGHDGVEVPAGRSASVVVEELLVEEVSIDGMCGVY